jgi:ribosomal protein L14
MIQMQTRMTVADNTGAKEVMCVKVLGGTRRRYAGLGDIVVCSVKSVISGSEIKKGQVVKGVVVRCKSPTRRVGRQLRQVRHQRLGADRQRPESARHAHLRRRGSRTA